MKRTISLIIAIAVMISMFVLPASAAEYVVDMTTLNGAARFTAAEAVTEWGITSDVIGLHYVTGEAGVTNGNVVDIPLDLSGCDTMVITYRNGVAAGSESSDIMLKSADYATTYGTFDLKGTGNWGTTAEASIDVSSITATTTTYHLQIQENATNGAWITGIKLVGDNVSGGGSTDPVTPPASGTVTTVDGIAAGTSVLGANIAGVKNISSGTYVIDLAGYKWTGQLAISGTADVTIMDSSAGKTGLIDASQMGDAIDVSGSAKLTLDAVKVIGGVASGDAIFVSGGTVVSNNSILSAGKAGIDITSASASVTVNGGSFPEFTSGGLDERNAAIELRWNAKVTLNGDIDFTVNRIVARKTQDSAACHTNAIADSIVCGANATATFTDEVAVVDPHSNYNVTEINYTYSAPAADPAFVGASLTLTSGITLNFFAEGVSADDYIMVGDTKVTGVADGANYKFGFGDFGPQQMGDEFTAELFVDDVKVAEYTYSVKQYCYDTINAAGSSAKLVKLAKAVLNYGAAAQMYRKYKTNALVNADLNPADKSLDGYSLGEFTNPGVSGNVTSQYDWNSVNVYFADKLTLVFTFKANNNYISDPSKVVGELDGVYSDYEVSYENGVYTFMVTDILPTQYYDEFTFYAVDEAGTQIMQQIVYSVSAYAEMVDGEDLGNFGENYNEPTDDPINDLVKALMLYGDAAVEFVAA